MGERLLCLISFVLVLNARRRGHLMLTEQAAGRSRVRFNKVASAYAGKLEGAWRETALVAVSSAFWCCSKVPPSLCSSRLRGQHGSIRNALELASRALGKVVRGKKRLGEGPRYLRIPLYVLVMFQSDTECLQELALQQSRSIHHALHLQSDTLNRIFVGSQHSVAHGSTGLLGVGPRYARTLLQSFAWSFTVTSHVRGSWRYIRAARPFMHYSWRRTLLTESRVHILSSPPGRRSKRVDGVLERLPLYAFLPPQTLIAVGFSWARLLRNGRAAVSRVSAFVDAQDVHTGGLGVYWSPPSRYVTSPLWYAYPLRYIPGYACGHATQKNGGDLMESSPAKGASDLHLQRSMHHTPLTELYSSFVHFGVAALFSEHQSKKNVGGAPHMFDIACPRATGRTVWFPSYANASGGMLRHQFYLSAARNCEAGSRACGPSPKKCTENDVLLLISAVHGVLFATAVGSCIFRALHRWGTVSLQSTFAVCYEKNVARLISTFGTS
ncbi:unnamed protein product [Rangifer tarandus platyrhynchus]|uniref:Uncharacterized protein n=1 Tax=Rangifer tarandus platyrhynchus TaxID=3082113 RepID=A0ABN8XJ69_RANTA|nr:unnamed protein product [Rangifer tarandus platyrhynchus]